MLLLCGILWYAEFVVTEAYLISGGRHVIIILYLFVCRSLMRAGISVLLR